MDVQDDLGFLQLLFPYKEFYQMNLQTENDRNGKLDLKQSDHSKNNMTEKETSGPGCQLSSE